MSSRLLLLALWSFLMPGSASMFAQQVSPCAACAEIANLPIPIGAGTVEVWHDSLYFFGGSSTWGGRLERYDRVYKFDGTTWSYQDSIPDDNVWDVESVLVGDEVYLIGGWPNGARLLRKYDLANRTWTSLSQSQNPTTWGITAEYLNGSIYLFNAGGNVFEYNIASDTWTPKTQNSFSTAYLGLSSYAWQDDIYIVGFYDRHFYKYAPATDSWTPLSDTPYQVAASAMGMLNGLIYCVGGSEQGNNSNTYKTVITYDIDADAWLVDYFELSSQRTWMAATDYRGKFYVLGGFDSTGAAVDTVEAITPQGPTAVEYQAAAFPSEFALEQNYPNPFNPTTTISYALPGRSDVTITIFNALGQHIRQFYRVYQTAGHHTLDWDGTNGHGDQLSGGIYYYRMVAGRFTQVHKMLLIR